MGHSLCFWCGGSLLLSSIMLLPLLANVVFVANGYPMASSNISSSAIDITSLYPVSEAVSPRDDLAISSEEIDDDDRTGLPSLSSLNVDEFEESQRLKDHIEEFSSSMKHEHTSTLQSIRVRVSEEVPSERKSRKNRRTVSHTDNANPGRHDFSKNSPNDGSGYHHKPAALHAADGAAQNLPTFTEMKADTSSESALADHTNKIASSSRVRIIGVSIDYDSDKRRVGYDLKGSPTVLEGMDLRLTLYGHFAENMFFKFSKFYDCDDHRNKEKQYPVYVLDKTDYTVAAVDAPVPLSGELNEAYFCLSTDGGKSFHRQGQTGVRNHVHPWLVIKLQTSMFPPSLHIFFIVVLLILSGLFSGLNLGLMSLDKTDLKIIMNTGSKSEKNYAQSIAPVRNHGNFLLCCLLFSNVLVNATLTILVDDLTSGVIAIVASTLAIVIFGEIIPQAICSRFGLAVGARTIYITKFFMMLTSPLAYPLSKILDKILGEEIGNVYTRERLKELLEVTRDKHGLEPEEVGIISGALDLRLKTVKDVMVKLDQIYMLPSNAMLDYETMADIEYQGYSRIPVYDGERSNVVALINVKQLTLLDASDNIPLRLIMDYYKTDLFFVFENTHLDFMFKAFREGSRGHMAFVQRVNDDGPGDPYYETVGMLTMEDVLEEILQTDIRDENDIEKLNARAGNKKRPPAMPFKEKKKTKRVVEIPATLLHAASQYLCSYVEAFKNYLVAPHIVHRLLKSYVQFASCPKRKGRQDAAEVFLYEAGKPADYFILILEGRVNVTVGQEKLMYEAGPFAAFGSDFLMNEFLGAPVLLGRSIAESALSSPTEIDPSERLSITSEMVDVKKRPTFIPDYSVKVVSDVYFLRIKFEQYHHARAATEMEKVYEAGSGSGGELQDKINKVMESVESEDGCDEDAMSATSGAGAPENKDHITINGILRLNSKTEQGSSSNVNGHDDNLKENDEDQDENKSTEVTKLLQKNPICTSS